VLQERGAFNLRKWIDGAAVGSTRGQCSMRRSRSVQKNDAANGVAEQGP
jgi:hypothetical protein